MTTDEIPGRALATRRAASDIVRTAALGSYGVAGFAASPLARLTAAVAGRTPGIRINLADDRLVIGLSLRVAAGLPVAEVARQVDSAVRHAIRRALGREVDQLHIRVGGLETHPGAGPPAARPSREVGSSELADSGTDVA